MDLQRCCLETFFEIYKFFVFIHMKLSNCYHDLVQNNELCYYIHYLNNKYSYLFKKQFCNQYVEPKNSWIGIFYHDNNEFKEKIYCENDTNTDVESMVSNLPQNEFAPLLMMKDDKICICKLYESNFVLTGEQEPVQRFFLQCLYTHPEMESSLEIIIPKSHYIHKNQILSYSYIERYLHYQNEPFVFDKNYTLEVIDKDLENIKLTCNDSVVLYDKEYTINH